MRHRERRRHGHRHANLTAAEKFTGIERHCFELKRHINQHVEGHPDLPALERKFRKLRRQHPDLRWDAIYFHAKRGY